MQVIIQVHVFHVLRGLNLRLKAARVHTHTTYFLTGNSCHVFLSQGYVMAKTTESHQSIEYLGG